MKNPSWLGWVDWQQAMSIVQFYGKRLSLFWSKKRWAWNIVHSDNDWNQVQRPQNIFWCTSTSMVHNESISWRDTIVRSCKVLMSRSLTSTNTWERFYGAVRNWYQHNILRLAKTRPSKAKRFPPDVTIFVNRNVTCYRGYRIVVLDGIRVWNKKL